LNEKKIPDDEQHQWKSTSSKNVCSSHPPQREFLEYERKSDAIERGPHRKRLIARRHAPLDADLTLFLAL
jgi:hypothetical protein